MATPAHDSSTIQLPSLQEELDGCFEVCERLKIWAKNHRSDADEPLTELLCNEIRSLCTTVLLLRTQVTELSRNNGLDPRADPCVFSERSLPTLKRCKTQLAVTMELFTFHTQVERRGQEGALNALYARMYILDNTFYNCTHRHFGTAENLVDLGFELKSFIAELAHEPPAAPKAKGVVQRFEQIAPKLDDFYSRLAKRFYPRHLYSYKTLADTPYVLDATGGAFSGSYGTVQKVNHERSGETLAMKTCHGVFSEKQTAKVLREIGILEVCNHKNIVRLVQAFMTDDDDQSIHFVMAPWAPYTLSRFLNSPDRKRKAHCPWFQPNSAQSDSCVYRMMYELADAVGYLHKHEIKHKDLKPENILIHQEASRYPTVLVTDVGVSKVYKPGAPTNYKDSTYEYLAPEQHAMKESTFKSDVWQLGCCFAALLVVAKRGLAGHEELQDSFIRDDPDCLCSIAYEHPLFMATLATICVLGNSAQRRAYSIVVGMLEVNPHSRPSIDLVKGALGRLPGVEIA